MRNLLLVPELGTSPGRAGGSTRILVGRTDLLARVLVGLPDLATAAVSGAAIPLMALVLLGQFRAPLTIALALLGAATGIAVCGLPSAPVARREVRCSAAAAVGAAAWCAANLPFTARDVYATRDPATYTITGRWLMDHASLVINAHPEVFGSPPGTLIESGSYARITDTVVNSQGNHMLPALLAVNGQAFGTTALFLTNPVLAALALLAFFGLARRIVGAPYALLAAAALAVSMPWLYVSRNTFTEPVTALFLLGGLGLALRAWNSGRTRLFALAGAAAGCAAMVRIDSDLALAAVPIAAAALVATAAPQRRRAALGHAGALLAGAAVPALLGWLDLVRLARQYYSATHGQIALALAALITATLLAPVLAALAARPALRRAATAHRARIWGVASGLVVLAFAVLATRPLWQHTTGPRNLNLENMQRRWRHAVDGTRTYHEQSVHWLAIYYGWPSVLLGVVGYVLLLRRLLRGRDFRLVAVLVMGMAMSALYLWDSEITPDQPWAMRRYVPVVIPVLLIAAVVALRALAELTRRRRAARGGRTARAAVTALAAATVVVPAVVSFPMRAVHETPGQLAQLDAICRAVGPDGAVVLLDAPSMFGYGQAIRSFCSAPAIALPDATPALLLQVAGQVSRSGRRLTVLGQDPAHFAAATGTAAVVFDTTRQMRWPNQINEAPSSPDHSVYQIYLATAGSDGLRPVPPPR